MRALVGQPRNPLAAGFYTVRDAARLIEVGSAPRITGWLRGYPSRQIGPLLHRDFPPIGGKEELSFLDLMEVRFVEFFRQEGVKVRTLRAALDTARAIFREAKPLASSKVVFRTTENRKNVFVEEILREAGEAEDDRRLLNLYNRQYEIYDFIQTRLAKGVVFDPSTALASCWYPRQEQFPTIFIQPTIAYGHPVTPSHVPTGVIYDAWKAGDDPNEIGDWFSTPIEQVLAAIEFEQSLASEAKLTVH